MNRAAKLVICLALASTTGLPQPAQAGAPALDAAHLGLPHNIEAEQALLGAMLVNNEALYRVSDFLEARHFFEPVHQKIYEISSQLVRAGKVASPVTLKTFLPADADIGGLTETHPTLGWA